jgi:hypothetical protein
MNRSGRDLPSLEDTLAKGFASMHSEDESTVVEQPEEVQVQQEPVAPAVTPDYSKPTQLVENRSSFTVSSVQSEAESDADDEESAAESSIEVLDKPTSTLGDDFDVEW